MKRAASEESPIIPRNETYFEVKNWTGLLKWENGKLYNNKEASLCKRRVFQIKANGGESEKLIWKPRSYHNDIRQEACYNSEADEIVIPFKDSNHLSSDLFQDCVVRMWYRNGSKTRSYLKKN